VIKIKAVYVLKFYIFQGFAFLLCINFNAYAAIKWIEDTLVKSKNFRLPGRKALKKSDCEYEVILIDASESPIERPKKNSVNITQAKKSGTR
jgi:hypothetical protein